MIETAIEDPPEQFKDKFKFIGKLYTGQRAAPKTKSKPSASGFDLERRSKEVNVIFRASGK